METNASKCGLGIILQQIQEDGKYHPVAYGSCMLHRSEVNYHSSKLEFLTLKWAVTEQFKEYLMYKPFTIHTDNNPLTYILMMPNLDDTGYCWVSALARFHFKIEYLHSADNWVADVLSRMEARLDDNTTNKFLQTLDESSHDAKGIMTDAKKEDVQPLTKVEKNVMNEIIERARFSHIPHAETDNLALVARHEEMEKELSIQVAAMVTERHIKHNLTGLNWRTLQEEDPIIQHVLKWKQHNSDKNARKDKNHADRCMLEEYLLTVVNVHDAKAYGNRWKDLTLLNDLLFINNTPKGSTDMVLLFVVPACKHQAVLDLCHHEAGHQGRNRMYSLLQERFWWPKMRTQMMMNLQSCKKCKVYEKDPKAPLCSITAREPMDLVHVDLVRMEVTMEMKKKPVVQKVLVVTDHFLQFVQAYKVKDKRAIMIAKCLYDNYFRHYGFP